MKTFLALLISGAMLATFGCSGSSGGSDAGSGGAIGTGGGASGGAKGTGGVAGASGVAGHPGTGGGAGQVGATGGAGGVGALGGAGGHAGSGAPGGAGGHAGSGGAGGHAGSGALGGAGGHGTGGAGGGGGATAISCGKNVCTGTQYCCNQSCGLCAPIGSTCVAIACTDGGLTFDAGACIATPAQDSTCTASATPHFYRCILSELAAPCVTQSIGDVTNTYCCP